MKKFSGALAVVIFACACTKPQAQQFVIHQQVPAARGTYSATHTDNGNTRIEIKVNHLAEPSRIRANATTFMVWAESIEHKGSPTALGALRIDKDLNGGIEVITPRKNFQVFVTAEPSANVTAPTGERLLWADIGKVAE